MPFHNGEKWACYSCTKGHRSSKCAHYDRILYKVRKPGRPLNNCPHILPETIQPGTFVNTMAESMANGNPPREACNCKDGLVEVAIPKVKNCSCITSPTGTGDTSPPTTNCDGSSAVKSGRVMKKPQKPRRSKSAGNSLTSEMVMATSPRVGGFVTDGHSAVPENTAGRSNCCSLRNEVKGHSPRENTIEESSDASSWTGSPQISQVQISQPSGMAFQHARPLNPQLEAVMPDRIPSNQYTPDGGKYSGPTTPSSPYSDVQALSMDRNLSPQGSAHQRKPLPELGSPQQLVLSSFNSYWRPQTAPGITDATGMRANDMLMVPLTHNEYMWIQRAREAGVNFAQLPKFISSKDLAANITQAIPRPIPQPRPPENTSEPKTGGCCSKPPATAATSVGNQLSSQPPNTPRCQCGDACRCVPCADHPFNPAMMETIKGGMQLMHQQNNSADPTGKYPAFEDTASYDMEMDDASPRTDPTPGDRNDFQDFVFYNYSYGGACTAGRGDCMCGEGCTCVGCLTHGGHDGVPLDIGTGAENG